MHTTGDQLPALSEIAFNTEYKTNNGITRTTILVAMEVGQTPRILNSS